MFLLRKGRDALFDEAADCLGVLLRVGKANDAAVIVHAEQQHPADPVGKGADAFQPAFRFFTSKATLKSISVASAISLLSIGASCDKEEKRIMH